AQQAAGAGSHPDADQLTAFQERSLGAREREQVLEHLARCAHCREVVTLALPPEEAARAAAPGFRWLQWPSLRWAAVAATFVIAVTLMFRSYREAPETFSSETARNRPVTATAPAQAKQAEPARTEEAQPPAQGLPEGKEKAPSSSTVAASRDQEAEVARGPSKLDSVTRAKTGQKSGELAGVSGGRMDDYKKLEGVGKVETGGGTLAGKPAASAPAPVVTAQARRGPAASAAQQQVAGLAQQAPPSPPATKEELHGQPVVAAESRAAADQVASVEVAGRNEVAALEKDSDKRARNAAPARGYEESEEPAMAAGMHWIITAKGRVQRTLDGGRTWKEVALDQRIKFRAVSALSSDVWAGGEGGALYHSSDSGNHWSRVLLPAEIASATIVRVEFTDAAHGALATSGGETWVTSDAGVTWQKK
ncbi:MAG: YCF48-related protein, partial [Terriglobales bacterium]